MTRDEARAELKDILIWFDELDEIARAEVIEHVLAAPELVLAALGAAPVTTAVAAGEDGNWTEEDQPAWCNNCEEYGWGRPVVMLPEGAEKP